MAKTIEGKPETYLNPVYPHSFPDPFVLKFRGEYFAYCTGYAPDGNVFSILRSNDLVNWHEVGSAMRPLKSAPPLYWAPEVIYDNGKFYLYYSTGNEILMEIRVAISDRPDGGFIDAGVRLTNEEFAIDAHVFVDTDGTRYFFYATDFLEYAQIGTGTVVDRMIDWKTLAGDPRPVTRAKYDWQVYDPARKEKGGVRWYTVEGPTVLRRKGHYFEMFSGGNWQNKTYGVSFAVTDNIDSDGEWLQFSDGEKILPILRTIPNVVVGPGHNSVVRGPNNRELYCIYHRWTDAGRVLAIDRMDFAGNRIFVAGPTNTSQPTPFRPLDLTDYLQSAACNWVLNAGELTSPREDRCEIALAPPAGSFLCEYTLRFVEWHGDSRAGFRIETTESSYEFSIVPDGRQVIFNTGTQFGLPVAFDPSAHHLLRIECRNGYCHVQIDTPDLAATIGTIGTPNAITLFSDAATIGISAIEITAGFEETFEAAIAIPKEFLIDGGRAECIDDQMLLTPNEASIATALVKLPYPAFEIAANLAIRSVSNNNAEYGLTLLSRDGTSIARLFALPGRQALIFQSGNQSKEIKLPDAFEGHEFRQFRIVARDKTATAYFDGAALLDMPLDVEVTDAAVVCNLAIAVDMVRLTAI
jgi:GH43 family beta-xylosidase